MREAVPAGRRRAGKTGGVRGGRMCAGVVRMCGVRERDHLLAVEGYCSTACAPAGAYLHSLHMVINQ